MPNRPALTTVRSSFDSRVRSAEALYSAVRQFAEHDAWDAIQGFEPLYPAQARRIIALSFLQIVVSWEDLAEACFVRYLMGAKSPGGYAPNLRLGPAAYVKHAYQLASGDPKFRPGTHYLNWSSWAEISDRAHVYFRDGAPFANLSPLQRDRLSDAVRIRNRVAHASTKVRKDFVEIARRHRGMNDREKLPQGYDVGQLMLDQSSKCFGNGVARAPYFELYRSLFNSMADHICPSE